MVATNLFGSGRTSYDFSSDDKIGVLILCNLFILLLVTMKIINIVKDGF